MVPFGIQAELYALLQRSSQMYYSVASRIGDDFLLVSNNAGVLEALLRMRQLCCCPTLVSKDRLGKGIPVIVKVMCAFFTKLFVYCVCSSCSRVH